MSDIDIKKISEALSKADDQTIREIVRQGEMFLAAQLQSGLASDLRAMTMAAILAAILSFLVGGTASLLASKIDLGLHILTIIELIVLIAAALWCAILAARPTKFDYAGSNPRFWVLDVEKGYGFVRSMAGQAALYAAGIRENVRVLERGQAWLSRALSWIVAALIGAMMIEFIIVMDHLARTGRVFQ